MLTPKSLTLQNIGRFVEEQTVPFDQLGSLVLVEGQNNNTGGSSGAAKSTIFKALEFLLGLNDISNGVLQSRLTKESISVVGLFDFNGLPLKIERGKKLLIDLNGEITTGSSKLTEEKLDQILGMPRDLFRKILHKRQGEGGFFLDMGPSEVHKFLTSCLGLEKEQNKISILDNRFTELTAIETSLKSTVQSNNMGLQATQDAILSLGEPPAIEIGPEALQTLKNAHITASDTHEQVKSALKTESDELDKTRPQIVSIPFDRSNIERVENEIGTVIAQITDLEKLEQDRQFQVKSKISELQSAITTLNNKESIRQSEIRGHISAIQVEIAKLQGAEQTRQSQVRSTISSLQVELIKAKALVDLGIKAKEDATSIAKELQKVRSATCPTCEQGWITEACKTKEAQILDKISEYKAIVISGNEASTRISTINDQLQMLSLEAQPKSTSSIDSLSEQVVQLKIDINPKPIPELDTINAQIAQLKLDHQPKTIPEVLELKLKNDSRSKELANFRQEERDHQLKENAKNKQLTDQFVKKQTDLKQQHELTLKYTQDEVSKAFSTYEMANNKVKSFYESEKRFNDSLNKLNSQLLGYSEQLRIKREELALAQEELELVGESKKAIKSYLSCSFEDALDSIGGMATRLIRAIPNMANATVQFEGLKETKEGKIKEEVTCVLSMDGEIGIPVKSLSGGERSSTDLAIDLSVIKFIEERTAKGISLMVLDEPFTGLDSQNILEALEMLRECSVDKQLLIVDHNPVATQSIENKLTVIRDGQTSRIVR